MKLLCNAMQVVQPVFYSSFFLTDPLLAEKVW